MTIDEFRSNASSEEWRELAEYLQNAHNRQKALPQEGKYDFSYSGIARDLEARGLLTRKRRQTTAATATIKDVQQSAESRSLDFIVKDIPDGPGKISRSVQIREDIYARLITLEKSKRQYTHSAILNQLLDDALNLYGY